jgi:hypothetical protein
VDSGHSSKRGQEKLEWQLETLFIAVCGPKTAANPRIKTRNISKYTIADWSISVKGRIPGSEMHYFEIFVMLRRVYGTDRLSRNVGNYQSAMW